MFKVHFRRMLIAMIIGGLLGGFFAMRSPKVYEGTVQLVAGSPPIQVDSNMPLEVRKVLLPGMLNDLDSDTGALKSERIFTEALERASKELDESDLASAKSFNELYPLYDLDVPQSLNSYAPDQTRVVKIKVKAYSPEAAASIANNIAFAFADYRKQKAKSAVASALNIVQTGAKNAKSELDKIDEQYRNLKLGAGITELQGNSEVLTQTREALRQKRNSVETEFAANQAELASLESSLAITPKYTKSGEMQQPDPLIENVRTQISSARSELATLQQTYEDDSPFVVRQKEKVAALEKQLTDGSKKPSTILNSSSNSLSQVYVDLQAKVAASKAKMKALTNSIDPLNRQILEVEQRIAQVPGLETKNYELQRKRLVYEEEYQKNTKYSQELLLARDGKSSQILSTADKDRIILPVAPDMKKYIVLAAILFGLVGLAYSFAIESFKLPVHTSWQLAELTSLPVAAAVPQLSRGLLKRHAAEIVRSDFRPMESFRYMAFSMLAQPDRTKVILFTAVGEEVDSSIAAAELGVAMARTGARTIVVDADLRVPRLSELFQVVNRSGVAEILSRTMLPGEHTDLFVATEHDHLLILPAGAMVTNGLAEIQTAHVNALIEDLRDKADCVIINCPPVDVFADASRLARYVDQTCLVVSAKTTSFRAIPVAQEILSKSGAHNVTLVLNNASPTEEPFGTRSGVGLMRR
jgi:polysaccharide biosynthesis transport protein